MVGETPRVPLRALLLSVASLGVPVLAAFVLPRWNEEQLGVLIWLTALIPGFILAYYRGLKGVALALAAGMALLSTTQVVVLVLGVTSPNWTLLLGVVVFYLGISIGIGIFAELLHRQRRMAAQLREEINERKQAEEEARESEAKYRSLVENATYGVYRSSSDGRFAMVNPAMVEMLGYDSAENLLQLNLDRDVYVNENERASLIAQDGTDDRIAAVQVEWRRKDGTIIYVRLSGRPVRDASGPGRRSPAELPLPGGHRSAPGRAKRPHRA